MTEGEETKDQLYIFSVSGLQLILELPFKSLEK